MSLRSWKKYTTFLLLACFHLLAHGQQVDTAHVHSSDSGKPGFIILLQEKGRQETINSLEKYKRGRIAIKQKYLVEEIKNTTQRAKIYLKKITDSLKVVEELDNSNKALILAKEGVFVNKGTIQTQRNLAVSWAILTELLVKMKEQQKKVADYSDDLVGFRDRIDSLSTDSALYTFPPDSLATIQYIKKLTIVVKEIAPTDSLLNRSITYFQDLQPRVDLMVYNLHSSLEDVERFRTNMITQALDRELPNLNEPRVNNRPMKEIIAFSMAKEKLALNFYVRDNTGRMVILVLLIIAATIFIRSLKEKLREEKNLDPEYKGQLALRYPVATSIFIVVNVFQFIFLDPPFIFAFCLWIAAAACLSFIFHKYILRYWMHFWLMMVLLFILSGMNNMILQASRFERWLMLALAFVGTAFSTYVLLHGRKYELRERSLVYFIIFVIGTEFLSLMFNIFGRFNLPKTLLISGYAGIIIAVLFLWTVRLVNETLGHVSKVYKHPDKKLFYINFDKIGDKVPRLFYVFLVIGWFILVGRNFYSFKQMTAKLNEFLTTERTLGDYIFTINGQFVFFLILGCSVLLSRIISFFAEPVESAHQKATKPNKVGVGSWLLLIRIFIISLGLFFAFAASGIPLDKITIVIGALGVGVGLGLQGLVNNLVSGLIIAFEKPVNVGDSIEINNKSGTMKSIGFRSSVIALEDGANLIIPNGDLLSQHLVNWTMGKNNKRLSIKVSLSYDTDLEKVKQIMLRILDEDERVLKYPSPVVAANAFGSGSIDFESLFWLNRGRTSPTVLKSDIIASIISAFKEAGIAIAVPQQDLNIRSITNEDLKNGEAPLFPPSTNQ